LARVRAGLGRLRDEFLVRVEGSTVRGLHELRSAIASRLTHDIDIRDVSDTVAVVLGVIDVLHVAVAISRACRITSPDAVTRAALDRVSDAGSARELAVALHGFQLLDYDYAASDTAERLRASLAPGEIAAAVHQRFGVHLHDQRIIDLSTADLIADPANEMRAAFVRGLDLETLPSLAGIHDAGVLGRVLVGLEGVADSQELATAITAIAPMLTGELDDFLGMIDAARFHAGEVQASVLQALGGSTVVASAVAAGAQLMVAPGTLDDREPSFELRAATAAPFWQVGRPDGRLVPLLLAALPTATALRLVVVDELDDEIPPLTNLPRPARILAGTPTLAQQARQRQWRVALLSAVGLPQWTGRLGAEAELLPRLASAIDLYVRALVTGRAIPQSVFGRLQRLQESARGLPPQPAEPEQQTGPQPSVGAAHEPDPFVTLLSDPLRLMVNADPGLAAVIAFRLSKIASDLRAAGRWRLLPDLGSQIPAEVVDQLEMLRVLAAERAALGSSWSALCARSAIAPQNRRLELTLNHAVESARNRLERARHRLKRSLGEAGFIVEVEIIAEDNSPAAVWPPGRLLVNAYLTSACDQPRLAQAVMTARDGLRDEHRAVTVLVSVAGRLSRCLSGEVGMAWWARENLPAEFGLIAEEEPRGGAWREGVAAAARIRAARRWQRLHQPTGPMRELIISAAESVEHVLEDARSRLLQLRSDEAAAMLHELAACDSPNPDLRLRARKLTLNLANADLSGLSDNGLQ
jgi:hypothetical protein